MWIVSHLVSTCYAHGYGKFGNCLTLGFIVLCHYMWRWLSVLDLEVWARRLCLLAADNIDYFGCDCKTCYSMCVEVLPSGVFLEGQDGQTWKDHVRNCAPYQIPNVDGQRDPYLVVVPVGLWCMLCQQASRDAIMLIYDKCFQGWHMGCLMPPMEEVPIGKWFCLQCTQ
jgi:hypothetical protein